MSNLNTEVLAFRQKYQNLLDKAQTTEEVALVVSGVAIGIMHWSKSFQTPAHKDMALMFSATLMSVAERLTENSGES